MLPKLLIFVFFLLNINAKGQCVGHKKMDTLIFYSKSLKPVDTIHFTAIYKSIGKNPHLTIVKSLIKQKKITPGDYSTSLEFIPTGGSKAIYLPFRNADVLVFKELVKNQNSGMRICIQAIILNGYRKIDNEVFFIIDQVKL